MLNKLKSAVRSLSPRPNEYLILLREHRQILQISIVPVFDLIFRQEKQCEPIFFIVENEWPTHVHW